MEKQKVIYRYLRYEGKVMAVRREIPYEIKLSSRMILDEMCFNYNKEQLQLAINTAIESGSKSDFQQLSKSYCHFIWE
ncbi:IDEAL domain-containing protein [Virgibacillus sp. W0181]|uniref:IDEAL domain-containing protein n=1 Tax=Virgibacillus sp. W0181 TaxID=3391581 RepID=UPI003F47703F